MASCAGTCSGQIAAGATLCTGSPCKGLKLAAVDIGSALPVPSAATAEREVGTRHRAARWQLWCRSTGPRGVQPLYPTGRTCTATLPDRLYLYSHATQQFVHAQPPYLTVCTCTATLLDSLYRQSHTTQQFVHAQPCCPTVITCTATLLDIFTCTATVSDSFYKHSHVTQHAVPIQPCYQTVCTCIAMLPDSLYMHSTATLPKMLCLYSYAT